MKAYNLYNVDDLRYEEVDKPNVPASWALIKVKATGICSSDIPRIFSKGTYRFPTVPGHEFSGVVEEVGDLNDIGWVGKRVSVFPLIPCKKCVNCQEGKYEMCEHYDYIGSRRNGAFAEYVIAPIWNLLELSDDISYFVGAMFEPMAVALHAIKKTKISIDKSVAVIGSGMIGFVVAQLAKYMGAYKVDVFGNSPKYELAKKLGINYCLSKSLKDCYDVVVEAVGSEKSISSAIMHTHAGGSIVLIGNPEGDTLLKQDVYWRILRKQLTLYGTWNSSYESQSKCDWQEIKQIIEEAKITVDSLISHVFKSENLMQGLQLMKDHKEPYCKVMIDWE